MTRRSSAFICAWRACTPKKYAAFTPHRRFCDSILSEFVKKAHNDYTFKKIKPVTAKKVAEIGYKKSIKGKSLAIVGFKNRLTVFACRFFPRKMVTMVSAKNMKKE